MHKYFQFAIISSTLLAGCANTPYMQARRAFNQPPSTPYKQPPGPAYTASVNRAQIENAIENAVQALDDHYNVTPLSRDKLEVLFGVDLAQNTAIRAHDHALWKTLSNDGLYSITLSLADKPDGQSSYEIDWKQQAAADYYEALKNHTPPLIDHCLNPQEVTPFLVSHGWKARPGMTHFEFPAYVRADDPTSTQLIFGGTIMRKGETMVFGPCLNQITVVKFKPKNG